MGTLAPARASHAGETFSRFRKKRGILAL